LPLLSRDEARALLAGDDYFPPRMYGDRVGRLGRTAQGIVPHSEDDDGDSHAHVGGMVLRADDPRLAKTYAEFPLPSFDALLDAGLEAMGRDNSKSNVVDADATTVPVTTMVDVGSGLGRLVLYSALTRGGDGGGGGAAAALQDDYHLDRGGGLSSAVGGLPSPKEASSSPGRNEEWNHQAAVWDIHGIEIAPLLHRGALQRARSLVDLGLFVEDVVDGVDASTGDDGDGTQSVVDDGGGGGRRHDDDDDDGRLMPSDRGSFTLHLGSAEDLASETSGVLARADIIFAYSTAFAATTFSPAVGALILDHEWSRLLGECCRPGCVAITTDRALDPTYGWVVKDRIDVDNPEVLGSTGYIHVLEHRNPMMGL
jgi:hypothetical protein